jgi:hypothetical protein
MAELSSKARKKLPTKSFAVKSKAKTPEGKAAGGSYPIPDKAHARNALSRVSQHGSPAEKKQVRAAVKRKFPDIGKSDKKK